MKFYTATHTQTNPNGCSKRCRYGILICLIFVAIVTHLSLMAILVDQQMKSKVILKMSLAHAKTIGNHGNNGLLRDAANATGTNEKDTGKTVEIEEMPYLFKVKDHVNTSSNFGRLNAGNVHGIKEEETFYHAEPLVSLKIMSENTKDKLQSGPKRMKTQEHGIDEAKQKHGKSRHNHGDEILEHRKKPSHHQDHPPVGEKQENNGTIVVKLHKKHKKHKRQNKEATKRGRFDQYVADLLPEDELLRAVDNYG